MMLLKKQIHQPLAEEDQSVGGLSTISFPFISFSAEWGVGSSGSLGSSISTNDWLLLPTVDIFPPRVDGFVGMNNLNSGGNSSSEYSLHR